MKNAHGKHMPHDKASLPNEIFRGTIATAVVYTGSKVMSNVTKHPIWVFGLGVVAGYFVHKHRKDIIANATKLVDSGKDFVLQQKESLEDIVAETKE